MFTIIEKYFFTKRMLKEKKRFLFETLRDIEFIQAVRLEALKCDEAVIRKELASELNKEEDQQDSKKIKRLSQLIADSKSVKAEWDKLMILKDELPKYIDLLKQV